MVNLFYLPILFFFIFLLLLSSFFLVYVFWGVYYLTSSRTILGLAFLVINVVRVFCLMYCISIAILYCGADFSTSVFEKFNNSEASFSFSAMGDFFSGDYINNAYSGKVPFLSLVKLLPLRVVLLVGISYILWGFFTSWAFPSSTIVPGCSYPEMLEVYRTGRLLVLPQVAPSLISLNSLGSPVLSITWPYGPYCPTPLLLEGVPLQHWLELAVMCSSGDEMELEPLVENAMAKLTKMVNFYTIQDSPLLSLAYFTPDMFVGIPIVQLEQLYIWLEPEILDLLSTVYPSLHSSYLSIGISAEVGQDYVEIYHYNQSIGLELGELLSFNVTPPLTEEELAFIVMSAPYELSPSPWSYYPRDYCVSRCDYQTPSITSSFTF